MKLDFYKCSQMKYFTFIGFMDSFRIFIEPSNRNTSTKKYFVKRPCYMTKSSNTINQFDRGFSDSIKDFVI